MAAWRLVSHIVCCGGSTAARVTKVQKHMNNLPPSAPNNEEPTRRIYEQTPWSVCATGLLLILATVAAPAPADIFHLATGGTVEGKIIGTEDEHYLIRTTVGMVRVLITSVERIEPSETPFDEYVARVAVTPDTAEAQMALADWCESQNLRAERRRHLQRAVEIDPDFEPARRLLGYVQINGVWIDGRRIIERRTADQVASDAEAEHDRALRSRRGELNREIRTVLTNMLGSPLEHLRRQGRERLLAIRDPLAILPLSENLVRGSVHLRLLLVQILASFTEDEATLNLSILALVDPSEDVRAAALLELGRRNDPRVVAQYREALRTGNDFIVARAAIGLGKLQAAEAVPELIHALTAERSRLVEVPVRTYFRSWSSVYAPTVIAGVAIGNAPIQFDPRIGVCPGSSWRDYGYDLRTELQRRLVTVYRTEVLEALKRISGENFGFEREPWRRWYEETQK